MPQLFGYISNDFSLVESAFHPVSGQLMFGDGQQPLMWGVGMVQNRDVLLRKRLSGTRQVDFARVAQPLHAHCIVGWATHDGTARSGVDIPPYRLGAWLMAHSGAMPDFGRVEPELRAMMTGGVLRNIKGRHPGEVLVHFLADQVRSELSKRSLAEARGPALAALADAMRTVRQLARDHECEVPPAQNVIITDGEVLLASSLGQPLAYHLIDGIIDDPVRRPEPLFAGHRPKRVDHPTFRAAFVGVGLEGPRDDWTHVPEHTVLALNQQGEVMIQPV